MEAAFPAITRAVAGGLMIGLASAWLMWSLGRIAGISGIASQALSPSSSPRADAVSGTWRWWFLGGLVGGGLVFASLVVAPLAGPSSSLALLAGAGLLVGVGTVLGSGCTSGHGVCGLGRRSVRSLAATCTFMAAGMGTVGLMRLT